MSTNDFDPDDVGVNNGNYFGFPFSEEEAHLILMSAPWDVTTSFGAGAAFAPDAIIEVSTQLDFYDPVSPNEWKKGVATADIDYSIQDRSARLRNDAKKIIDSLENGSANAVEYMLRRKLERINNASAELNEQIYTEAKEYLAKDKIVGLIGGDHSVPLGLIKAVAEKEKEIGVLHLDAHCDLRNAYEGFTHSHASIMYNVLNDVPQVTKLVQVGLRDFSEGEHDFATANDRVEQFEDFALAARKFSGETWKSICDDIVSKLPKKVYVSFDIDCLTVDNCLTTGTPVVGGLTFNEAIYLIDAVCRSGRQIVGFDLCEVVPDKDSKLSANIGARVLFKLCGMVLKSN